MFDYRYKKIASIERMQRLGLNMHNTVITNSADEALKAAKEYGRFTIRTDRATEWVGGWDKKAEFPFIMQKTETNDYSEIYNKLQGLETEGFAFIVADGIKYDDIQNYNAVVIIETNGDFRLEASTLKIPLRKMYNKDGVFIVEGNIANDLHELSFYKEPQFDRATLLKDMNLLYEKEVLGKWLEFTRYPINVGSLHERFVFWQIRDA